jgi:hypothetical protein
MVSVKQIDKLDAVSSDSQSESKNTPQGILFNDFNENLERAAGIEPASLAWKAKVLPLHNARSTGTSHI